jgi:hypothetical protein
MRAVAAFDASSVLSRPNALIWAAKRKRERGQTTSKERRQGQQFAVELRRNHFWYIRRDREQEIERDQVRDLKYNVCGHEL